MENLIEYIIHKGINFKNLISHLKKQMIKKTKIYKMFSFILLRIMKVMMS
jgi:hypothetical protein